LALKTAEDAYDMVRRFKAHLHEILYIAGGVEGFQEAFWRFETDFEEAEEEGSGGEDDALRNEG
jgi:hypothetical protein